VGQSASSVKGRGRRRRESAYRRTA
jgi:hypothetical protein